MAETNRGFFDELARTLAGTLPEGMNALKNDMEKNFRAVLQANLKRMNLVTREEFEIQSAVLARTRAKLEAVEKQLAELEARLEKP